MIAEIVAFAAAAVQKITGSRGNSADVRAYLTNPSTGIQTAAGAALDQIMGEYTRGNGKASQDAIVATLDAIEQVRSNFESKVLGLGPVFLAGGGQGGINTINRLAVQLTKDRKAELAAIGGSYTPAAGTTVAGFSMIQLAIIGGLVLFILLSTRK